MKAPVIAAGPHVLGMNTHDPGIASIEIVGTTAKLDLQTAPQRWV